MAAVLPARTTPRESIGAKLRRLARLHRFDNPFVNGPMASPPTVTTSTSAAAGPNAYRFDQPGGAVLRTFGGTRVFTPSAAYAAFPVATAFPGGAGNVSGNGQPGNQNATSFQMEFMADAATVSLYVANSAIPYRILVQGPETGGRLQYVSAAGTVVSVGGGAGYANLAFGSRAFRRVVVEGENAQRLVGVQVGPTEGVYLTDGSDLLRGVVIGDSFVEGIGSTRVNDNYANVMMAALGIRDRRCSGLGGTGWINTVGGTKYTFGERIAVDLVPQAPDVAFFMASTNDIGLSGIQAEATTRLAQARSALPGVPFFVLGSPSGNLGPSAAVIAVENAVAAAVAALSDPLTIFVPAATDTPPWVTGTGRVGTTTGSGNADIYVSATTSPHYNTAGHIFAGLRAADAVMGKLNLLT